MDNSDFFLFLGVYSFCSDISAQLVTSYSFFAKPSSILGTLQSETAPISFSATLSNYMKAHEVGYKYDWRQY